VQLEGHDPSPVVAINRAIAVGFADEPRAGLAVLDALDADPRLERYQPLHAAAPSCCAAGADAAGADAAYATAIALEANPAQRAALERRRAGA
jgi:RNA polymerase sigma-70 factor, ECF subfamily